MGRRKIFRTIASNESSRTAIIAGSKTNEDHAALSNAAPTGAMTPVIYFSNALCKHI
jgi:hypothetical protein